jgi:hypothetical protein
MPASAHASTIDDGSLLRECGSALAQSATTPTSATGADELGGVAGEAVVAVGEAATVAGLAATGEPAVPGELPVAVGEAAEAVGAEVPGRAGDAAWLTGEAVAAGVEPALVTGPPWFE